MSTLLLDFMYVFLYIIKNPYVQSIYKYELLN